MWVFDGEEWTEEGSSEQSSKTRTETMTSLRIDDLVPELQVVEVVPVPRTKHIPPFPLP
ncbi:MAG TPA: hypothetical protein VMU84_05925 [Thermoanaerobaculia bacterium]|nr:hypothetical protein [Thermoanaerobaculia bacterium]